MLEIMFEFLVYHEIITPDPIAYTDCHLQNIFHFLFMACYDKFCLALSIKHKYLSLSNGFALVELFSSAYHYINICKWHILLTALNVKNRNTKKLKTLDITFMLLSICNQCNLDDLYSQNFISKRIYLFVTIDIIWSCIIYHIGMMREKHI